MDILKTSDSIGQSLNDYDSGQTSRSSNQNFKKNTISQKIYTRGSGPLRRSAEPEFDSTMTSTDESKNTINNTEDTNTDQKRNKKPDSPVYTAKGTSERDTGHSYQGRRGGRDNYSNNSQHRNQFTNNNRNKHRREFDSGKKGGPETSGNLYIEDKSNENPPVANHRSAILNQSTKSYERNVNNGPASSGGEGAKPSEQHGGQDHNRNNYRHNRNNQYPNNNNNNRRNYNNYDRGGRHHNYNRRDRDDRQYDNYEGGGNYRQHYSHSRHGSNVDVSADGTAGDKYASSETLSQSGRRYRGSHSDLARGQRDSARLNQERSGHQDNRGRNSRFRDSRRDEYSSRNSQSQQYNSHSNSSPDQDNPASADLIIDDTRSNLCSRDDDQHNDTQHGCTAPDLVNELSEQLSGANINDTSQQRIPQEEEPNTHEEDSESFVIDPSSIHSEYFAWSKLDWTAAVDDDVWASSTSNTTDAQDVPRSDPSPPASTVTSPPPPAPEDDKDWASIRNKPKEIPETVNNSWDVRQNNQPNQNWSRGPNYREGGNTNNNKNWGAGRGGGGGGGRQQQQQNSSGHYQEYNDRYGEPKHKQFSGGPRAGKGAFSSGNYDLPPRFRKKMEQVEHKQRSSNQQPPSSYANSQLSGPPPPLGTYSDNQYSGSGHYRQDNSHYNSLPRHRHNEGPQRDDYNRGRRRSTYEPDSNTRDLQSHSQPCPPVVAPEQCNEETNTKLSWFEEVEHEDKLQKLKSALSVSEAPALPASRGRGGFHGGRGRDERGHRGGGYHQEKFDSRSSSRSRRRRRKSGSSQGSRRRSGSRDTVDTNISSTGTTRSRRNSDRSAASEKNWRDRGAPQYEHSRSSEVSNWRDRGNSSNTASTAPRGQQDWSRGASLKSSGATNTSRDSWRAPPQISEEPSSRQDDQVSIK